MESDIRKDIQANEEPAESVTAKVTATPQTQDNVTAEVVTISGKARMVQAQTVNIDGGQVTLLRGGDITVDLKNGGIGAMFSADTHIDVTNGGVGCVSGKSVTVKAPAVGAVMAWNANVEGDAKFVFDLRAGLVAGVAGGLVLAAFRLLFGPRRR